MDDKQKGLLVIGITALGLGFLLMRKKPVPPPPPPPPGLANLYGRVTDKATGKLLAGVNVSLDTYLATTDATGLYLFPEVTPGPYALTFFLGGYQGQTQSVNLVEGNNLVNAELVPTAFIHTLERYGVGGTPTGIRTYTNAEAGWRYLINTLVVTFRNTGNGPFQAHVAYAVAHPYAPGAASFCSDQAMAVISGDNGLVPVDGTITITFQVPHAWGGLSTLAIADETGNIVYADEIWDAEAQRGTHLPEFPAPGGAINPEDIFVCWI